MKVYALVGKSGTGKSYHATNLCRDKHIDSIIDDGLFIYHNSEMVGRSAKREANKVSAIKRALFTDDDHRAEVVEKIREVDPKSVVILGTSVRMVQRIAARLDLPSIDEYIAIEDITTSQQRAYALKQREVQGKHVVPLPSAKLKKQFSGYFMDPIRRFINFGDRDQDSEKTVVRPTYSYLGDYYIAPRVIGDVVRTLARDFPGIARVVRVTPDKPAEDLYVQVQILCNLKQPVPEMAVRFQERCAYRLEEMTAFSIGAIRVDVRGVELSRQ